MAVSSGYQEISLFVICPPDDLIRARAASLHFDPTFCLYPVLREIANDIINMMARSLHLFLLAYLQDSYAFGLVKER